MTEPPHKWGELGYKAKNVKRSALDIIFFSPDEHRLRAGWRILAQLLIFGLFSFLWIIPSRLPFKFFGDDQLLVLLTEFGMAISITISVFLARKIIDERSIPSLGFKLDRWAVFDFLSGLFIAFIVVGAGFSLLLAVGDVEIRGFAWQTSTLPTIASNLAGTFLIFALVGWSEELLFRGYHLQNISEGSNLIWGVILSSIFFSAWHILNPGMTLDKLFFLFLTGVLFAYAYLITGQLWLAIGLHLGWDFFPTMVFYGTSIGRLHLFPLIEIVAKGPTVNLVVSVALVLGAILVYLYSKRRRQNVSSPAPE